MAIVILICLLILSVFGCIEIRNGTVKLLLGTNAFLLSMILLLIAGVIYTSEYKISEIDASKSPYGDAEVLFQSVGEPAWPFGPSDARLVLKQGNKTADRCDVIVLNDGKFLQKENWQVTWSEDSVQIIIFGEEQDDASYELYLKNDEN